MSCLAQTDFLSLGPGLAGFAHQENPLHRFEVMASSKNHTRNMTMAIACSDGLCKDGKRLSLICRLKDIEQAFVAHTWCLASIHGIDPANTRFLMRQT